MLRRPPTLITLTAEDIAAYEANRQRRQWEQTQAQNSQASFTSGNGKEKDPNDELKPLPQEKARIARSREERILGSRT
jgi:hypothetical protein